MTKVYAAQWVVPVSSSVIEEGAVAVDEGIIVAVGTRDAVMEQYPQAPLDTFPAAAIIPGLINCHSHLELTAIRVYL